MAARRKNREVFLDLCFQLAPAHPRQGPVPAVEAELPVLIADEVEHGKAWLVVVEPESTAELLEKHRRAVGGPQEQHGVDCRNIDTFVEQVDREDRVNLPSP